MGMTQGLLAAMVADTAPEDLRGTAYGLFNLVAGVSLLAASATAGWLWERVGPAGSFLAGAGFATLCLLLIAGQRLLSRDPASA
jgi:MFS family permease